MAHLTAEPQMCGVVQRRCDLPPGHEPAELHQTGRVAWRQDLEGDRRRTGGPSLAELAGSDPDFTGGVEPAAYVRALNCPHHDDPAVCAALSDAGDDDDK